MLQDFIRVANSCFVTHNNIFSTHLVAMKIYNNFFHTYLHNPQISGNMSNSFFSYAVWYPATVC